MDDQLNTKLESFHPKIEECRERKEKKFWGWIYLEVPDPTKPYLSIYR